MKVSLWIIGSLLTVGLLFLSYFYVFGAGGYEGAIAATGYALVLGLPLLGALIGISVLHRIDR